MYDFPWLGKSLEHSRLINNFPFYDENNRLTYVVQEYDDGEEIFQIPVAVFSSGDPRYEHMLPFPISKGIFYNANLIVQNPNAKIVLSPLLFYANSEQWKLGSVMGCHDRIYSSWYGEADGARSVDVSFLDGREVELMFHTNSEISDEDAYKAIASMNRRVQDAANIQFAHYDHVNQVVIGNMDKATFSEYVKGLGYDTSLLESVKCTRNKTIEDAQLPPAHNIKNRPVIIHNFMNSGKIMVLAGCPKAGKSFLASRMAYAISIGGSVLGHKMEKSKVLYCDIEMDDDDYLKRGLADKQSENFKIILCDKLASGFEGDRLAFLEFLFSEIVRKVIEEGFEVVVIDPLYKLINENSKLEVQKLIEVSRHLKEKGVLVIWVHHLRQDPSRKGNVFDNIAGHSDIQRNYNGGLVLMGTGEHVIDDNGEDCPVMEMHYQARGFKNSPKLLYFGSDCKHHICDKPVVDDLFSDLPPDDVPLAYFIRKHVPLVASEALTTTELIDIMCEDDTISWKRETLKKKLPEWEKAGYFRCTGKSPKRYYIGKKIERD